MLPFIAAGVAIVAVGSYLLNDAEEERTIARKKYNSTKKKSKAKVENYYNRAYDIDQNDKRNKAIQAKIKIKKQIGKELKFAKSNLYEMNLKLKGLKDALSDMFEDKRHAPTREEKRAIQEEINVVMATRKEIFSLRDSFKQEVNELYARIDKVKQEIADLKRC